MTSLPEGSWLSSTLLLAVAIGSAVGCVPLFVRLARRTSKRQSYRLSMLVAACAFPLLGLAGLLPGIPVEAQVILATLLIGAPIGAHYLFPIPLTGDVIDDDSGRTHAVARPPTWARRHFVEHTASALAPLLLVLLMFAGNTRGDALGIRLVGPVAGLVILVGYVLFRRYDLPDATSAADRGAPRATAPKPVVPAAAALTES